MKNIRIHIGSHHGVAHHVRKQHAGIYLQNAIRGIFRKNQRLDAIAVFDGIDSMAYHIHILIQIHLEGSQVIGADLGKHLGDHRLFHHRPLFRILGTRRSRAHRGHCGSHIRCFRLNGQRIVGKSIFLDLINILLETGGQRHDQRNANDADGSGKGRQ